MAISVDELRQILAIGHDTSMRGVGISLHEAIQRSRYLELRPHFTAADLVPLIRKHPEFIEQWSMYGGQANQWRFCDS